MTAAKPFHFHPPPSLQNRIHSSLTRDITKKQKQKPSSTTKSQTSPLSPKSPPMPAQQRSSDDLEEESRHSDQFRVKEEEQEDGEEEEEQDDGAREHEEEAKEEEDEEEDDYNDGEEDSDGSRSSDDGDKDEYVTINLADIRKEVQCPICLGIIRKTRTVMECLHRFCRICIDKSMRMGNNECPACRTHCASRRSLRDDPNFDALIAVLYHDIDKYEAEELAFHDEEKTRNKQIQESIAQTFQRQTEALGKKRPSTKAVATFMRRSRGRKRGRGSRNNRLIDFQGSDDDEDGNGIEEGRDSSSAEERSAAVQTKRRKRWPGPRSSQPSSVDADGVCDGIDDLEAGRESTSASPGFLGTPEVLAWGKGGIRSHTRYGSVSGTGKNGRYNRIAKLVDHLRSSENNVNKLDVQLIVIPLDKQTTPSMEEPFLYCKPTTSVGSLCQFVAHQTPLEAKNIEILVVKEPHFIPSVSSDGSVPMVDLNKDKLQAVEEQETLGELVVSCNFNGSYLVLAYREKASM